MRTRTRVLAGTTTAVAIAGLGAMGATPALAAPAPPAHHVVRAPVHHDLLAVCRQDRFPHRTFLVRVHNGNQLRFIERRFDLRCRVIRHI